MAFSPSGTRDSVQQGNYQNDNKAVSSYHFSQGLLALPLAEANTTTGAPVEIVRVHQPIRVRTFEYDAAKSKTPPLIPSPEDNTYEYLLSADMNFPMPIIGADRSTLIWQSFGEFTYVEKGSWTSATGMRIGNYPIVDTPLPILAAGAVLGGAGILALDTPTQGEDLANQLPPFNDLSYADKTYDYARHFPSRFMVSDLSLGN